MKNFDTVHQKEENSVNQAMERGYEIYDAWELQKSSSKSIVAHVYQIVSVIEENEVKTASIDVLAVLFALDLRIKEKYHNLWQRIFSYFSWRRETRALKRLKGVFFVSDSQEDIRTLVESELQNLRETRESEKADGNDDQTHGGKHSETAEDEAFIAEEQVEEQTFEDTPEEIIDTDASKESFEEKTDSFSEELLTEEPSEEIDNQAKEPEVEVNDNTELLNQEELGEIKEENHGPDEASESNTDKTKASQTDYNEANFPLFNEMWEENKSAAEETSIIDEIIMDNLVKAKKNPVWTHLIENNKEDQEATRSEEAQNAKVEKEKNTDKDSYLYDQPTTNNEGEATQRSENDPETKIEHPKEQTNKDANVVETKEESKDLREQIQVDVTQKSENDLRRSINENLSKESIEAIYCWQAEAMREQLNIASAELGIKTPVKIIGMPESSKTEQTSITTNRK